MIIRDATEADLPAILELSHHFILHTTAVWHEAPDDLESRRQWLRERQARQYPVLVAEDGGQILGFASFGDFRAFSAYHLTVENSIYVRPNAQAKGVGTGLLQSLIARAVSLGKHVMVAAIEAENISSLRLHQKLGFTVTGRMPEVGRKFGRWLDLVLMQKMLG